MSLNFGDERSTESVMSQQKVDAHKKDKKERAQRMEQEKKQARRNRLIAYLVCAALVALLGVGIFFTVKNSLAARAAQQASLSSTSSSMVQEAFTQLDRYMSSKAD